MTLENRKENFIKKATEIHNWKYNYSLVEYHNNKIMVKIVCPNHGEFEQRPDSHLNGRGCAKCFGFGKTDKESLTELKKVHNNKYEYPSFKYLGYNYDIQAICKIHGEFNINYRSHYGGNGCPKCSSKWRNKESILERFNKIHNNKYTYIIGEDFKNKDYISIICPEHGEFKQNVKYHLIGHGCPTCAGYKIINGELTSKLTLNEFIIKSNKIHNNLYDYSKSKYKGSQNKITITCTKHGDFEQKPVHHLMGSGCQKCNISKGEKRIEEYLISENIEYTFQWKINRYSFDFYLNNKNIAIEFDGAQHFEPIEHFGGISGLNERIKNDAIKNKLCQDRGIKLIRIPYTEYKNIEEILKKEVLV